MKTYTKDELMKKMVDELEEELEGIIEYDEIYNSFKELGLEVEADEIEQIARDEYDHACAIWDILDHHGCDVSHHTKIQDDWAKVKRIFAIE